MRYNSPEQDSDPRSETHDTDSTELTPHDTVPCPPPAGMNPTMPEIPRLRPHSLR